MDAQVREESQSRRTSIKRSWEDGSLPEEDNAQLSAWLPPIDTVPYRRPSLLRGLEHGSFANSRYDTDSTESRSKRAKLEGYDYNLFSQQMPADGQRPPPMIINPGYSQHRGSVESPKFLARPRAASRGPAESQSVSILCSRCRRLATQDGELDLYGDPDNCESCSKNPELVWVTQAIVRDAMQLTKGLVSAFSSEERGLIREPGQRDSGPADYPPIAQYGLKQSLNWILGRINQCNNLVDDLVRQVPAGTSQNLHQDILHNGPNSKNGPVSIMKRRIDVDSEDAFRARTESSESTSDARLHTRRRSLTTTPLVGDDYPPMRSQPEYNPSRHASDGQVSRVSSIMNPPPAPTRQLPSPPTRSFPSPTSLNFPSPSVSSFGNPPPGVNLPPPSSLHQSTSNNYLPPIATTHSHSPDSALRDHTAALQHEVSVQKIALSSLQGEHDKLLAAFSRSQTRAQALEKKHAVSDNEIISLSEEKQRLQTQVLELERDVDEMSRSRDEYRQAAVQEGSQYVEIVKKASRLEEIAGEERKTWNKLKGEMEERIEALSSAKSSKHADVVTISDISPARRLETDTPTSSADLTTTMKLEPINEVLPTEPTSFPTSTQQESVDDLREEIRSLRARCAEVENALRTMRNDSRSIEGLVKALLERADSTLVD